MVTKILQDGQRMVHQLLGAPEQEHPRFGITWGDHCYPNVLLIDRGSVLTEERQTVDRYTAEHPSNTHAQENTRQDIWCC